MSSLRTFGQIAGEISARSPRGRLRLVAVDGRAGSGKSTLARRLAGALGQAPILQLDDFLSWDDLTEFWPRLEEQVLLPLFQARNARYQARDWDSDPYGRHLGAWKEFPFAEIVVLEGVGSARQQLCSRLAYSIWVETPRAVCLERGILRDGQERTSLWMDWQRREDAFFEADPVKQRVELVVDGQRGLDEGYLYSHTK
jgi:energy-coupling factor transporter ATP-binding protein EcfA2